MYSSKDFNYDVLLDDHLNFLPIFRYLRFCLNLLCVTRLPFIVILEELELLQTLGIVITTMFITKQCNLCIFKTLFK